MLGAIRAGAMAAGRSWPYIKAAANRVGNWISTKQAAAGGARFVQVGKPQTQYGVASKYLNSSAGAPWKQYLNQRFPPPNPANVAKGPFMGGRTGQNWMDNFNSNWQNAVTNQKLNQSNWINANKSWLAKEAAKVAGNKAVQATNKALQAAAGDPAAQAAVGAAAAAAVAALANKLLNPDQIVVNPNNPTPTPGPKPRPRPSPKPKPGPRPKPRPGPNETPEEENPDSGSSCDDDIDGTAQPKPKYREVTMFTQYGTITVKGPA